MNRVELVIKPFGSSVSDTQVRAIANKWKFNDKIMGEQFITLTISSEVPVSWAVGDYCVFRGQTFTLNYIPSVIQNAKSKESGNAFVYENVKFNSYQDELTRCLMLDVVATSSEYHTTLGTNFTGSSKFSLYCGEVTWEDSQHTMHTSTAVCTLAVKMQANLDRLYNDGQGHGLWSIEVDTTTTTTDAMGNEVLVTHTDDKMLNFDNYSVAKALEMVHNDFDLDYCIEGRTIKIGYILEDVTSDDEEETYAFGYGKGYPTFGSDGKALFQIKKVSESNQLLVTRLRALGSTKNMPYRYYNERYGEGDTPLTQTMFPTNLQLPDTFLPYTNPDQPNRSKSAGNTRRDSVYQAGALRHVKGDTNDSYIDKNDDAASCAEGIREASARWDGSDSNLQEIYPTIEEVEYSELRGGGVPDQSGTTGSNAFPGYGNTERVDQLLAIGYYRNGTLVDDANAGNGILPESGTTDSGIRRECTYEETLITYPYNFSREGNLYIGRGSFLFSIQGVSPDNYIMAPTNAGSVVFAFRLTAIVSASVAYRMVVRAKNVVSGVTTDIASYTSEFVNITAPYAWNEIALPMLPDGTQVQTITVDDLSDISVTLYPILKDVVPEPYFTPHFFYKVDKPRSAEALEYTPEYVFCPVSEYGDMTDTFHVFIKDMGFEPVASGSETPIMSMKTGQCVGRDFEIGSNIQKVTYQGKKGYMLTLNRAKDTSLNIYYPSSQYQIHEGDQFVLLNIDLPDAYIDAAEVRLLKAATDYLADNCDTRSTYQVAVDEIFLQRNYDNMVAAHTPEKSVFWRLYAGKRFRFNGIPTEEGGELPECDITIDTVTISMGESLVPKVDIRLSDDIQQGTLQKLTTAVEKIYNGLLSVNGGQSSGGGISESRAKKLFLSKTEDDSTPHRLSMGGLDVTGNANVYGSGSIGGDATVEGGLAVGDDATVEGDLEVGGSMSAGTDSSGNPLLEVDDTNKKVNVGADLRSRNFRQGVMDGQGWQIDKYGNAELESAVIRSSLTVQTLIVNRQQAQEGDTIFSDNDQFENVEEVVPNEEYIITVKEKWEGYYSAQLTGNILKGIINTFAAKDAGVSDFTDDEYLPYQGKDNGGNIFYTSWMLVVERWGDPSSSLETNQFRVVLYGDDYDDPTTGERVHITPAGKNFPPCKLMVAARWGSVLNPDEQGITEAEKQERKRRQTLFLISVTDGRITKYSGVNKPILEDWMCGMAAGETPTFVKNWASISPQLRDGYDYLYAQGIIVSDFIKVDSLKRPIVTYHDCGEWIDGSVPGTTVDEHWNVINTPAVGYGIYLVNEYNPDTLQYETHDVWHNGKKWRCLIHQPVSSGGELIYHEPVYGSSYWQLIGGGLFALGFYTDDPDPTPIIGLSVRPAHVDETVVPYLLIDQEDISSNVTRWIWERESNYPDLDEAWKNSAHVDPTDPTSPLKSATRTIHITTDDLPSGWDAGDGHVAFKCSAIFGSGSNQSQIINRISIV